MTQSENKITSILWLFSSQDKIEIKRMKKYVWTPLDKFCIMATKSSTVQQNLHVKSLF